MPGTPRMYLPGVFHSRRKCKDHESIKTNTRRALHLRPLWNITLCVCSSASMYAMYALIRKAHPSVTPVLAFCWSMCPTQKLKSIMFPFDDFCCEIIYRTVGTGLGRAVPTSRGQALCFVRVRAPAICGGFFWGPSPPTIPPYLLTVHPAVELFFVPGIYVLLYDMIVKKV